MSFPFLEGFIQGVEEPLNTIDKGKPLAARLAVSPASGTRTLTTSKEYRYSRQATFCGSL